MMGRSPGNIFRWLFDSRHGLRGRLVPRWIFLRALALIYFSAFLSLIFQINGLIGPQGVMPAQKYLLAVTQALGPLHFWYAPTLFWTSQSSSMLLAVTWIGLIASLVALVNVWPRLSFFVCFVCFLSFVTATEVFSMYQSDGMLLEAGFIALFLSPGGILPGWGAAQPPSRMSFFLLQWEWFRIYFESGMVKLLSGDVEWRNFTAMDEYYQNGPLPTWIGWYVEHLPHWFHAATVGATLAMELALVFMMFFPRRVRLICFFIVTPWELGVILTANYTFLNYLVLSLGFLLLDDQFLMPLAPTRLRPREHEPAVETELDDESSLSILNVSKSLNAGQIDGQHEMETKDALIDRVFELTEESEARQFAKAGWKAAGLAVTAVMLTWIAYDTTIEMISIPLRGAQLPFVAPIRALEPFRIANQYGLFAVMTRGRYEIEFQGSNDGTNWTTYPFRFKPQVLNHAPGIYAPYQPRFDWNLWFASLGGWQQNSFVPAAEERLLMGSPTVLSLFGPNPFQNAPPKYVRAVMWQYWFTSMDEKQRTGNWWRREYQGLYAPELTMTKDGDFAVVEWPAELPSHE
jgi:hypothetical protein